MPLHRIRFYLLFLLATLVSGFAFADGPVLEDVRFGIQGDYAMLQVDFGVPVKYVRHFPASYGPMVQIKVKFYNVTGTYREEVEGKEVIKPRLPDARIPLEDVIFEGNVPGGPYVTLRFSKPVKYIVQDGIGFHSILVMVELPKETAPTILAEKPKETPTAAALLPDAELDKLLIGAREALAAEKAHEAIDMLSKLLAMPDHKHSKLAREMMGIARQRAGQADLAKQAFEEYLRLYPEGEDAARVRQRLAVVDQTRVVAREKLKTIKRREPGDFEFYNNGRWSQNYFKDDLITQNLGEKISRESVSSFLSLNSRARNDRFDFRLVFSASDLNDRLDDDHDERRIRQGFVDARDDKTGLQIKLGRQSSSGGGVLGYFDGTKLTYQINKKYQVTLVQGEPYLYNRYDIPLFEKSFLGLGVDMGPFREHWSSSLYAIKQEVDGISDREALGADLRYFDKRFSFYQLMDYDTLYDSLNMAITRVNWQWREDTKFNLQYDQRKSPIMLTSNAVQGQGVYTIRDLIAKLELEGVKDPEAYIHRLTQDVSAVTSMFLMGVNYVWSDEIEVNADVTGFQTSSRGDGPTYVPGTDLEFRYSAQLVSKEDLFTGDITIYGLSYSSYTNSTSAAFYVNTRVPIGAGWGINASVQASSSVAINDLVQERLGASTKIDYNWKRLLNFEFEMGVDTYNYNQESYSDYQRRFVNMGYAISF